MQPAKKHTPKPESVETALETLTKKLHPARFPDMSGKMAAIVGCILHRQYTNPRIAELVITADGCVLGRHQGDIGYNDFIGSRSDLESNWKRLLDGAELSDGARKLAEREYRRHITTF